MQTLLLIAVVATAALYPDGVILPQDGFGERAELVQPGGIQQLAGGAQSEFASFVGSQLPPSDRAKWYMTVYVDRLEDPESRLLLQDLDRHKALAALKAWCKFQVVDKRGSPSDQARMLAAEIEALQKPIPTILIYPNPDDPVFGREAAGGWRYTFQASGYGGDAESLARNIYDSIRSEYKRRGVEQCPGPYCPQPNPQPNPDPYLPQPNPNPPRYEPYRPPRDDWTPAPLPRMDQEPRPLDGLLGFSREELIVIGCVLLALFVGWRRGWFDKPEPPAKTPAATPKPPPNPKPPGGGAAALLLVGLLGLAGPTALSAADQPRQNQPAAAQAAELETEQPVGQLDQPNQAGPTEQAEGQVGRYPIGPPAVAPPGPPFWDAPCELAVFDRLFDGVRKAIRMLKLFIYGTLGLGLANLVCNVVILRKLKRGHT